jgi:hypothetical protein
MVLDAAHDVDVDSWSMSSGQYGNIRVLGQVIVGAAYNLKINYEVYTYETGTTTSSVRCGKYNATVSDIATGWDFELHAQHVHADDTVTCTHWIIEPFNCDIVFD